MTTAPLVSLHAHDTYDPDATLAAVEALLEPLGGMGRFVPPGASVLLKPNLVFGCPPEKAVNPHPAVVRAAAKLAYAAGAGRVLLGDSPGLGTAHSTAKKAGYLEAAEECGVEVVEFTPVEHVDARRRFARLELAREVLEADVVVNLPKMKTHGQMLMTLAVKNMFGAVPGPRKFQWHYRAGRDRDLFARMINEIAQTARPHLSILDAVVGMDGLGPTAGNPRDVGFLAASADPWALDAVVMDVLGIGRERLFTLAAAAEYGPREWQEAEVAGPAPHTFRPEAWDVPEMRTLQMHGGFVEKHIPRLARWLRDRFAPRPRANADCVACGYCAEICPADAMRMEKGRVRIDDDRCIRCYCCHELCRHRGLDMVRPGLLARLLGLR